MIPRFSLYGTVDRWSGDIQEDLQGRWLKWLDVEEYVQYALTNGYTPPPPSVITTAIVETLSERAIKYKQGELFPTDDLPEDRDKDLVELMNTKVESESD